MAEEEEEEDDDDDDEEDSFLLRLCASRQLSSRLMLATAATAVPAFLPIQIPTLFRYAHTRG
ncbi:hypothetical protein V1478_007348 [Vespula squamosa]|uniref:Uncharacterized protein n=1 Tax=Vespula squamosa TaxID=30214 RepID=A0ABD2B2X5_VESSQ